LFASDDGPAAAFEREMDGSRCESRVSGERERERERERESADYLLPPLLPQFTDNGKNQWNLELGFLVRCAMQESLYCDGEFLFSARSAHAKLGTHSKTRGSLAT
jgi:hypothetical protein